MRRITSNALLALSAALLLAASGCGDDKKPIVGPGGGGTVGATVSGTVYTFGVAGPPGSRAPLAGVRLVLVRDVPLEVVSGPVITGANGAYSFAGITPESYTLLIFTPDHIPADGMDARIHVTQALGGIVHDINMFPSAFWSGAPPHVLGKVTDAATGLPVANAFVATITGIMPFEWQGITTDRVNVTGASGDYVLHIDPSLGSGLGSLLVAAPGYNVFVTDTLPVPLPAGSLVVDVALTKGGVTGAISGRVLADGRARAGVVVGLEARPTAPVPLLNAGNPSGPVRTIVPGKSVITDTFGYFAIPGVTPGSYLVHAAYPPDDGWFQPEGVSATVIAGGNWSVGNIHVTKAVAPVSPVRAATAASQTPVLTWTAVPGAASYRASWGVGHLLDCTANTTATQTPVATPLPSGATVRWVVSALDTAGVTISSFEAISTFVVP